MPFYVGLTVDGIKFIAINKLGAGAPSSGRDAVIDEQPVSIFIVDSEGNEQPLVHTLATPTELEELALGFLFAEGFIESSADLLELRYSGANALQARLRNFDETQLRARQRWLLQHGGCGLCSARLIDASAGANSAERERVDLSLTQAQQLSAKARALQAVFARTGGGHAAALAEAGGEILHLSEDVGRHNAVDKLIGWALANNLSLRGKILWLSGRAGFELVQKAARTELGAVVALGAPSTLACALAEASNLTLMAFVKNDSANIYNPRR